MGALPVLLQLAELAGPVLQLTAQGVAIYGQIQDIKESGVEPTPEQWASLNANLKSLTAQLNTDPA